ncbi:MAG: hypothetical protein KatS3mg057_1056 [Herpetosiphonaceae bacterium]|nr:MAG: hypothetical protein KatS3mg057_1056 [Herpetosiphonaceae bacterium]
MAWFRTRKRRSLPALAYPQRRIGVAFLALVLLAVAALFYPVSDVGHPSPPEVYVALGASDAVGIGADDPERHAWPSLVQVGLPDNTRLINLGISGATLRDVLRHQLPPALDARPRWVSIWPGVNDLRAGVPLPTFTSQLDQLLGTLRRQLGPDTILLVVNIPDLRPVPVFATMDKAALDAVVQQWNAAIAASAERHGALLVDLYAHGLDLVEHPEYLSADGFHPSSAGYQRIADLVLAAIEGHDSSFTPPTTQ